VTGQPGYSAQRSTAIHEAGHAVMSYLLGRAFTRVSVIQDENSYGRVNHAPAGKWFRPDITINARTRNMIEDHVMISLAGGETERHWCARQPDAPAGWQARIAVGEAGDVHGAVGLADYMCGGLREIEAYIEWLRQRVLSSVGRLDAEANPADPPAMLARARDGDPRYWALVMVLADAVQDVRQMPWQKAREVLRAADRDYWWRILGERGSLLVPAP
jgi:hypothetical protein